MKNKSKIGIGIIIVGYLISLNPFLLIIAVPIFIVGLILLLYSNESKLKKICWGILPPLLWYPGVILFISITGIIGVRMAQKIDFVFEQNFKGKVMVISNMECGQEVQKINDREQLIIPHNGILLYQGEIQSGYVNHNYYYETEIGIKIKIPEGIDHAYIENSRQKPDSSIVNIWVGGMGIKTIYQGKSAIKYEYSCLTVNSLDSIGKYSDFHYFAEFEQLGENLVRSCKE